MTAVSTNIQTRSFLVCYVLFVLTVPFNGPASMFKVHSTSSRVGGSFGISHI